MCVCVCEGEIRGMNGSREQTLHCLCLCSNCKDQDLCAVCLKMAVITSVSPSEFNLCVNCSSFISLHTVAGLLTEPVMLYCTETNVQQQNVHLTVFITVSVASR